VFWCDDFMRASSIVTGLAPLLVCALGWSIAGCSPATPSADVVSDAASSEVSTSADAELTDVAPSADAAISATDSAVTDATLPASDGSVGTGGSGGLPCASTATVDVSGTSYRVCVARVGEVELKIVAPPMDANPAPLRLAVYLHGDGARAHTGNTTVRLQAPWAAANRAVYVSALAPNRCAWWLRPSFTACNGMPTDADIDRGGENVRALTAAIDALSRGFNLDLRSIYFGGSSGGAFFLTASWIPAVGDRVTGAYALVCGAHAPWTGMLGWDGTSAALRGRSRLSFTYGAQDEFLTDITGGVEFYRAAGFALDERVLPNTTHCAFDHIGRVAEVWTGFGG
jgi:hypothetical protein